MEYKESYLKRGCLKGKKVTPERFHLKIMLTCKSFTGNDQTSEVLEQIRKSCKDEAHTCTSVLERKKISDPKEIQKCRDFINTSKTIGTILESRTAAEVAALPVVKPQRVTNAVQPQQIDVKTNSVIQNTSVQQQQQQAYLKKKQALIQSNDLKRQQLQAKANAYLQQKARVQQQLNQLNQFNQMAKQRYGGDVYILSCSF